MRESLLLDDFFIKKVQREEPPRKTLHRALLEFQQLNLHQPPLARDKGIKKKIKYTALRPDATKDVFDNTKEMLNSKACKPSVGDSPSEVDIVTKRKSIGQIKLRGKESDFSVASSKETLNTSAGQAITSKTSNMAASSKEQSEPQQFDR